MNKGFLTTCWVLFFLFLYQITWAQNNPEVSPSVFKKVELRLGVGGFGHKIVPDLATNPERYAIFTGSSNIGWQVLFDLEINDKFAFSTGFKTSPGNIHSDSVNIPSSSYPDQRSVIDYDFQEWEIPLRFRYYFGKRKLHPYIDGSISINRFSSFYYSRSDYHPVSFPDGKHEKTKSRSKLNTSFDAGVGLHYELTTKLSIALDARYQLAELYWSYNGKEIILNRPIIGLGVFWKLKEFQF